MVVSTETKRLKMSESEFVITSSPEAEAEDLRKVHAGLLAYNEAHAGPAGFKKVNLLVRDASGLLVAGLMGYQIWGWLKIQTLWVDESVRGRGMGSRLLAQAEDEAREGGCAKAWVDTYEFQAPAFYESRGYSKFATLEEFPPGHECHYLTKNLGA